MTERRFNADEAAAIFETAAQAQQSDTRPASTGEGLTLAELQDIGREVGLPASSIARAAQTLGSSAQATTRPFLGFPLRVERTIHLGRTLSNDEWERLVVDLRETFDARGTVRQEGSFRQWTNGNLQVLVEPTPDGHRIRFRTMKGDARGMLTGGLAILAVGGTGLIAALAAGIADTGMVAALGFFATLGATMFGSAAIRVPRWAQLRRRQMDELANRLASDPALPPKT
jgi:hypothetical protein